MRVKSAAIVKCPELYRLNARIEQLAQAEQL